MWREKINKIAMAIGFLLLTTIANGQTFNEWFKQKKTQIKYLLEQIAQLQAQIELLKKGYEVVQGGLNTIHQIKEGEFNLHNSFFTSLKNVNPAIAKYADVADIVATQTTLINGCNRLISHAITSRQFSDNELELFTKSFEHFKEDISDTFDELMQVTTAGKLEMTDNERIVRIRKLKERSDQQRTSLQKMANQLEVTVRWRLTESGEIGLLRQLYGE